MKRLPGVVFLVASLVGCQAWRPALGTVPGRAPGQPAGAMSTAGSITAETRQPEGISRIKGRVEFPGRRTQASTADLVSAATVSFIDTSTNTTVATTKTDGAGRFSLALGNFSPDKDATYVLCSLKSQPLV